MSHAVSNLTLLILAAALAGTLSLQELQRLSLSAACNAEADARSRAATSYVAEAVSYLEMQAR